MYAYGLSVAVLALFAFGSSSAPTSQVAATGGHAFNMVNMKGTVVIVDGQSGEIRKPTVYFGEEHWHDFHFHVTVEGAPGKSPIGEAAP